MLSVHKNTVSESPKHHFSRLVKNSEGAFSTIELIIAFAIMVSVLSAVTLVAFGDEALLVNGQTQSEALGEAQGVLEEEQSLARKDFDLVNPLGSTTHDVYERSAAVMLLPDYLTKRVDALVSWRNERGATSTQVLSTLISRFDASPGVSTCDSSLHGDWTVPHIINTTTDFATLVGDSPGMYTLSDIDAYKGKLYVTATQVSGATKPTFFIFDITNPAYPTLLGKTDNEGSGGTVSTGLAAVRVAEDVTTSPVKTYAYAANAYAANYSTCNPQSARNCGELAIIDVTNPNLPVLGTNLMLASSSPPFVRGSQARGTSIAYTNGSVCLGLAATGAGNGPEFNRIDVHAPTALYGGSHIISSDATFAVGNDVNAIAVRGSYAYIVTPNTQELQILNITNAGVLPLAGSFNSVVGGGNGKSLSLMGNKLYLGVTVPNSGNDFHILDNTNPATALAALGGLNESSSVNSIIVRDFLTFLLTNTELRIQKSSDPAHISGPVILTLPKNGHATTEPSMDCEGNTFYIVSNDAAGHGALFVVQSS